MLKDNGADQVVGEVELLELSELT
jgi:hypothetical protein